MSKQEVVVEHLRESISVNEHLISDANAIAAVGDEIVKAFRHGNKILLFGNGGSAADAQHIAAEFAGKYIRDRGPLPAIALTTNTSSLTAIGNDYGYEYIYSRQVQTLAAEGDIVIGISTSGNSPNVLLAMKEAKRHGAITVALTGKGGKLRKSADFVLAVPSQKTPHIQEAHITIGHILCQIVEEELFGKDKE